MVSSAVDEEKTKNKNLIGERKRWTEREEWDEKWKTGRHEREREKREREREREWEQ